MEDRVMSAMWIALGGGLGAMGRLFLSDLVDRRVGGDFPWGTMAVNVSGAFAIGIVAGAAHRTGADAHAFWQFVVVGLLGGYTTVSSLSLHTWMLARDRRGFRAFANIFLTVALCVTAVAFGFPMGMAFGGAP